MTKKLTKITKSTNLLNRILEEPKLVSIVRNLEPKVLTKVIQHIGLEDCGEIVALATTDQLKQVFDEDLWKAEKPGREEKFDPARFGVWLEVMTEMGPKFVAEKLAGLDKEFLVMTLSEQILVLDLESMLLSAVCDSDEERDVYFDKMIDNCLGHDFDKFTILSKNDRAWDSVLFALLALDSENYSLFNDLLESCALISSDYIQNHGGLEIVLTHRQKLHSDVSYDREQRREEAGYVPPLTAGHFLTLSRSATFDQIQFDTVEDNITKSYFRYFQVSTKSERATTEKEEKVREKEQKAAEKEIIQFMEVLAEYDVVPAGQSLPLLTASQDEKGSHVEEFAIRLGLSELREKNLILYEQRIKEFNYLANILISGCSIDGRKFRPYEAADAALATSNLGLEYLIKGKTSKKKLLEMLESTTAVKLFRLGWSVLHREVGMNAAEVLLAYISAKRNRKGSETENENRAFGDMVIEGLSDLSDILKKAINDKTPWKAKDHFDVLEVKYDQNAALMFKIFMDECPATVKNLNLVKDSKELCERQFVAHKKQIEEIHEFLAVNLQP